MNDNPTKALQTKQRSSIAIGFHLLKEGKIDAFASTGNTGAMRDSTSIFDPVLCEIAYRWFSPPGGRVLDPFAGGSVRGLVAHRLGRRYTGVDLSAEQVAANVANAAEVGCDPPPRWIVGDSRHVAELAGPGPFDVLLTCPPYAYLEQYSADPADLSTLDYPEFLAEYRAILAAACGLLAADAFAVLVVSEVRSKKTGDYLGFVPDTIAAMRAAGLVFHNEAILVNSAGSLPIRAARNFPPTRRLGRMHQNVLVFARTSIVPSRTARSIEPRPARRFRIVTSGSQSGRAGLT